MASYSGHESSCSDADLDFSSFEELENSAIVSTVEMNDNQNRRPLGKFGYNNKCFYFVYCPFPITQVYKHALHVIKMHYILYVTD